MKIIKTYYLIDYENVGSEGFKGCEKIQGTTKALADHRVRA